MNDLMKMAKINENTVTESIIDSVRMFAKGKDVITSKIVRKRPFKNFNEPISSGDVAQSPKL